MYATAYTEWSLKGATLSDKSAKQEYGLSEDELIAGMRAGKLQFREASMHGNPWWRLLRREVEDFVTELRGESYLRERQARTELARIDSELKQLRKQQAALTERRAVLQRELSEQPAVSA
jgi:hypothetical protein